MMVKLKKIYHDGEIRPNYRGILHSMFSLLMFANFMILYFENDAALYGSLLVFSSYIISTFFHLFPFEKKIDYWINVIDHIFISLHGIGMQMLSSNFNLYSYSSLFQISAFTIDSILCININNYIMHIYHILTFVSGFAIGFFNTFGLEVFTNMYYFIGMASYLLGAFFYIFKIPYSGENWGYHELYHLFIAVGDSIFFYDAYALGNL